MRRPIARRSFNRPKVNWQWVRFSSNDAATVVLPAGNYLEDLLQSFKTAMGLTVNLPDITIWRILLKISITIKFPAAIANPEAYGALMVVFVDDKLFTFTVANTDPYFERFLMYKAIYYSEAVMMGEAQPVASATGVITKDFDIKAHRRLENIEDTLLLQVSGLGGLTSLNGLAYSGSVLLRMGRR